MSSRIYNNASGMVLACPMTTKNKNYPFEIPVNGPKGRSFVLADQIRSIDIAERVKKCDGKVSDVEMSDILAKVAVLFQ